MADEDIDWQTGKNLKDANGYMFDHEIACDVTFLAGEGREPVKSHKFILISRSPVFYAMMVGPLAETSDTITVPDIEKDVFIALLRFLYTEEVTLDGDNVVALLYAAKKYGAKSLVAKCCAYLIHSISCDNVCEILNHAHFFEESVVKRFCLSFINSHADKVMTSEGFSCLNSANLADILKSDELDVWSEESVYRACVQWSREQCRRQGLAETGTNQREVLGNILPLIRFASMDLACLTSCLSDCVILTDQQKDEIRQRVTMDTSTGKGDSAVPTRKPRHASFDNRTVDEASRIRVRRVCADLRTWTRQKKMDAISFCCSRDVYLCGVGIYQPVKAGTECTGRLELRDENSIVLADTSFHLVGTQYSTTTEVMLQNPVPILKDHNYTLIQNNVGEPTYYGSAISRTVYTDTLTVTFSRSCHNRGLTTEVTGQFPELIFV